MPFRASYRGKYFLFYAHGFLDTKNVSYAYLFATIILRTYNILLIISFIPERRPPSLHTSFKDKTALGWVRNNIFVDFTILGRGSFSESHFYAKLFKILSTSDP